MDDDGDDKDDTKRRTRNLSEKKRRDQFNMLVNELGTMVSTNNRKMDKSTILKSTISFLKNHNELTVRSRAHDINDEWKPAFLSNEEFTYLVLEALEGFLMVFSATGRICYVSESITSLLGHNPADIVTKSIFDLAYEEDRPRLYNMLQNPTPAVEPNQSIASENEITFQCHIKRGTLEIRDEVTYELVQFHGHFRKNMEAINNDDSSSYTEQEPRMLFVCTGTLYTPQLIRDVSLLDSNRNEFTSRHSLEWKFLFLDHRAPPIIGYLPFEVLGTSGYDYYHFDDLEKVTNCHEVLMQKGEMTSCYYRFLTKGQQWIWLQTRFYITYHQWNSKPEFVVCTHRVVSYDDLAKSMKQDDAEVETASEAEVNNSVLKGPSSEEPLVDVSPSYLSETSDAFGSYQQMSQSASVKSAGSTGGTVATTVTSATANASWPRASHTRYATGSDTASMSGDSRSSQRHGSREIHCKAQSILHQAAPVRSGGGADSGVYTPYTPQTFGLQRYENETIAGTSGRYYGGCDVGMMVYPNKQRTDSSLVPQHGVGAQYLEPAPYVGAVPGVLPLPLQPIHTVPVIVSNDQAQIQEQLQRKHEELQQMIVRQQEELRQVKEQLLLARLGILQPLINVPNTYVNPEEGQQTPSVPTSVIYDGSQSRPPPGYMPQPPNASDRHPHLPQ